MSGVVSEKAAWTVTYAALIVGLFFGSLAGWKVGYIDGRASMTETPHD